ncbi:MAG: serine hydrolase, partial [Gemmatimonadales bacterium]|nr:serine hydrolase [Gemmatimonadales bacterium]
MSLIPRSLGAVLIPLLGGSMVSDVSAQADDPLRHFGDFVESVRAHWRTPGVAVAVVKDGSVIYAQGFGLRDVERRLPVTTRTRFPIGSATKPFTAMAVGMLVDDGKLDLDEPLVDRIPGFRLHDDYATMHASIRDLLSHRTGIPSHFDIMWLLSPTERN